MTEPTAVQPGDRLALFPLNLVLFPGGLLPLRICEPRYQRMVSECLREQLPFAVVAIIDGPEAGGVAVTATSGCLARIVDWETLDDGLLGLLCVGEVRVSVDTVELEKDRLMRGRVYPLPAVEQQPLPEDRRWMADLLDDLLRKIGQPFDRLLVDEPSADHVAHRLIELLPLPVAEKQRLFELTDARAQLDALAGLISPA